MKAGRGYLAVAVLAPLLGLAGCGRGPLLNAPHDGEPVQIRVSFFGSYEEWELFRTLKREFEATNPGITLKLEYWPGGTYEDKLKLTMAAGNAPDIMAVQDEPFPAYCKRGQFEDLTPYLARAGDAFARDRFFKTGLETWHYHGRPFAVPWNGGEVMLYFNRRLFRRIGMEEPPPDWDWDRFLAIAKQLTQDLDRDGRIDQFGFELASGGTQGWMNLLPWIWGAGADVLDPEMTRCILNSPEGIRGLQVMYDMRYTHHVTPHAAEFAGTFGGVLFMTGRLGMMTDGVWRLTFMRQTDLDWDIAHMPYGPAGRFTRGTWDGFAIYRRSRHKEAAWKFIEYAVGERGQFHVASSGRALPPRRSQAYAIGFVRPDTPQHEERFVEGMSYFRTQRIPEVWAQIDVILRNEFERMLVGRVPPAETAREMERQINAVLARG